MQENDDHKNKHKNETVGHILPEDNKLLLQQNQNDIVNDICANKDNCTLHNKTNEKIQANNHDTSTFVQNNAYMTQDNCVGKYVGYEIIFTRNDIQQEHDLEQSSDNPKETGKTIKMNVGSCEFLFDEVGLFGNNTANISEEDKKFAVMAYKLYILHSNKNVK
ncbi:hypothetical protein BDAP_001813 [Binucleata daphniae]